MTARHYFLLTSLPGLPELGEAPPTDMGEFRRRVLDEDAPAELIDALILEMDLVLREAAMAGEIERPEPVVLTLDQAGGDEPLPEFLAPAGEARHRASVDATWEAYYRHVAGLARKVGGAFAAAWVGFEVALRNALVVERAKALDLEASEYLVAEDLADRQAATAEIVAAWLAASDPLAGLRALDAGRWQWMQEHAAYFSFGIDELAAYARGLVLLTRWRVLRGQATSNSVSQGTS